MPGIRPLSPTAPSPPCSKRRTGVGTHSSSTNSRGLTAHAGRASSEFTEWDGNLAALGDGATHRRGLVSATGLQTWATCPYRYFLSSVLGIRERDDPEQVLSLDPAERGTLVHKILEQFVGAAITRPEGPPNPDHAWSDADHAAIDDLAESAFAEVEQRGAAGRPLQWRRTKSEIRADLHDFLRADDAYRATHRATPVAVEMRFGMDDAPPVRFDLPNSGRIGLRGVVDRVDRTDDGGLVVIDYKTGRDNYKGLGVDPVLAGTALQLPLYVQAAIDRYGDRRVTSVFWMISAREEFRQQGYDWNDQRHDRFLSVTDVIVEGIDAGVFPARPGEYNAFFGSHDNCGFCDFDRLCARDRDDHERAIADARELAILDLLRIRQADS